MWLFLNGAWYDFTISSLTNDKNAVMTTAVTQNKTAKKTAVQACFDETPLNLPGPIGLKR